MKVLTSACLILLVVASAACSSASGAQTVVPPSPPIAAASATSTTLPSVNAQSTVAPLQTAAPTDAPSYVAGVGRIISSAPTSMKLQKLHTGTDALWYWTEDGSLGRADPASGKEVATLNFENARNTMYGNPKDMAVDGKTVWVTDAGANAVARMDPITNQIVGRIALDKVKGVPYQVAPMGLALDGNTLWVSDFEQSVVLKVDTLTKKVVATIDNVKSPEGIAVSPGAVWVVQHLSNSIVRIDPTTNKIVATIDLPGLKESICGMCIDYVVASPDAIWVPLDRGKGVARIDPKTNQVVATIPLGMDIRSIAIGDGAIWAAGSFVEGSPVCDTNYFGGLVRISPATNAEVGRLSIPCAFSVAVANGDVWVGTTFASNNKLYRIKPDP